MRDSLCLGACPFSHHSPLIGGAEITAGRTCTSDMLAWSQFDLVFGEDLVQMYVEHHVAVRCLRPHVSLPVSKALKSVMDDNKCVGIVGANSSITRLIE